MNEKTQHLIGKVILIKAFSNFRLMKFDCNDARLFFDLIEENRDRLNDFFAGTVSKTKTLKETQLYCDEIKYKIANKAYFPFVVVDNANNKLIGWIDVKHIVWNIPTAEIGYFIDKDFEGKKIISKALGYALAYIEREHQFKKLLCRV